MKIRLNGAWRELDGAWRELDGVRSASSLRELGVEDGGTRARRPSLAAVLERLGYSPSQVATALNGEFVPARARDSVLVREGDRIEVLAPMQGG